MSLNTTVTIVGGIGFFLLGMAIMTDGLKALAGSALRVVLAKAAATSVSGTFWGAVVTLLVQSSSATTMTTIGLVSAGLLTFPQGLSLVFGANIGTTGTGWLVALLGVRISLTTYALPIVFVGALLKLMGKGRWAASGAAIAGFALILVGLTTLQQGMGGLAEQLNPADLPAVLGEPGVPWWSGALGVVVLVVSGIVMTTVMQSSTAAITVTIAALYAGAINLDQALALVIGQNIGTSTSSAMAAIGASSTAKRLAVAYVAFKIIAAVVALILFPVVVRLMLRASESVDPVTLVAVYHTAYNVMGVAILLPLIGPFTRVIERNRPGAGFDVCRFSGSLRARSRSRRGGRGRTQHGGARARRPVHVGKCAGRQRHGSRGVRSPEPGSRLPVEGDRALGVRAGNTMAHQHRACPGPHHPTGRSDKRERKH